MWGRIFRGFGSWWIAVIAATLLAVPADAQTRLVGEEFRTCIRPADTPGLDPVRLIAEAARLDCTGEQRNHSAGDYWVLSEPLSLQSTDAVPLVVRTGSLWQGLLTLNIVYADGMVIRRQVDGPGMSKQLQLGAISQFDLPPRTAPIVRLAWRIDDAANVHGVLIGGRIATRAAADAVNLRLGALYAGFVGLAIALLVYNFALWGALRYRFQLAYCAMVATLLAYCLTSSGAIAWMWPDIANNDRIRLNYALLALAAASALIFARSFFEPEVFRGWLSKFTAGVTATVAAAGLLFAIAAPYDVVLFDRIYAWAFVAVLTAMLPILWRAWSVKSNYLWLFAIAWAAPVVMASARAMHHLGLIQWRFWLDNSTIIAMACEALLSSVAIAYRIRLLSKERDFAVAQEAVQRKLADTDPLTGLLNRRAFLNAAIGRGGMQQLLLIDIDHFKAVNETLGHDGGDEVLRVFARVMRQVAPDGGLVARLGGEEFAVLAPPGAEIDPDALLARLRAARMPFDLDVTASIGVCRGGIVRETDWKSLYRAADRALFDAKAAGRDRVRRGETLLAEAA